MVSIFLRTFLLIAFILTAEAAFAQGVSHQNIVPAGFSSSASYRSAPVVCNANGIFTVNANCYTTVASALAAAVAAGGGVISAQGCSTASCLALGKLDVGNRAAGSIPAVTIYLGPFNYTATQIVLRAGFHLIGMSNGDAGGSGTVIKATSASTPLVVGPPLGTDFAAQHVGMDDIRFTGAASNTADGMFLDTAGIGSGGLGGVWYSQFRNLTFDGFGGVGIHIRGATNGGQGGVNQWLSFYDCTVFRTLGGGNAVRIEGANYQQFFYGGEFDSVYGNSNIDSSATPNVYVGCASCALIAAQPYIVDFFGPTIQGAATLIQVDGAWQVVFDHPHHEQAYGAYLISIPNRTFNDEDIVISGASFNGTVGVHSGTGHLMNVTASHAMGIVLQNSIFPGNGVTPDHYFESTGGAPINCCEVHNMVVSNSANNWPAKQLPTDTLVGRIAALNGTKLTTSAFAFSGSWGNRPAFNSVRGTDGLFSLTLTSGSGTPGANPQIQLTFADGTWTNVPICTATGTNAQWVLDSASTATILKVDFFGTPSASTQYTVNVNCGKSPN